MSKKISISIKDLRRWSRVREKPAKTICWVSNNVRKEVRDHLWTTKEAADRCLVKRCGRSTKSSIWRTENSKRFIREAAIKWCSQGLWKTSTFLSINAAITIWHDKALVESRKSLVLLLWLWILSSQRSWRRKIKKKDNGNAWRLVREGSKHCPGRGLP